MARARQKDGKSQMAFTFEAPVPARREAELAGFDKFIAGIVSRALREDSRSRPEIAGAMTALLAEEVSAFMLDAYASAARDNHNIPAHRLLALIAVTERFDLLDTAARRIGAALLVGEEIHTARLGHLDRQIATLRAERKRLETKAHPIDRGNEA